MFRLLWLLSTPNGRRALFWLIFIGSIFIIGQLLYESMYPPPAYTRPPGRIVTTVCTTGGEDCDEYNSVRLWVDTKRTSSTYAISSKSGFCVATKSYDYVGEKFWLIDCGLIHGNELPVIKGWVPENNLIFTGDTIP